MWELGSESPFRSSFPCALLEPQSHKTKNNADPTKTNLKTF